MTRNPRRKHIDMGGFSAIKIGLPSSFDDLYYSTMEMSWVTFVVLVSLVFVVLNLAFGLVYAMLPGAIANAAPGSIADGFFFSVETLGTVGYGNMAPVTRIGHAIAATEILTGLFFSATITGLIFARFARPRTSFLFSKIAVIGHLRGRRALMIRIASIRSRPLVEVTAQVSWLERVDLGDGRRFARMAELPLERATNPMLALSWTLIHFLEDDSPMLAALATDKEFRIIASVSGLDTLLANQATGGQVYNAADVLVDHEFVDAVSNADGTLELDLGKIHDVIPSGEG